MCKPCWLAPAKLITLNTIIAGSIRPPHRLIHAKVKVMHDDLCSHPQCKGARSDTMHIFWNCHRWRSIREPYLRAINNKIEMVKKVSQQRYKLLMQVLDNNCFRQCGICPGNEEALRDTYQINDNDPYKSNALNQEEVYHGYEDAEMYKEGDYSWYKVYTDGSG